jgi:hypothetical protein
MHLPELEELRFELNCDRPRTSLSDRRAITRSTDLVLSIWYYRSGIVDLVLPIWYSRSGLLDLGLSIWYYRSGIVNLVLSIWYSRSGIAEGVKSFYVKENSREEDPVPIKIRFNLRICATQETELILKRGRMKQTDYLFLSFLSIATNTNTPQYV